MAVDANDFSVGHRRESDRMVVKVCGEVDLATSPQLSEALQKAIDESLDVAVDLSATTLIDSTGISVLLASFKGLREKGGNLWVSAASPPARKIFEIAGLVDILSVPGP